MNQYIVRQGDTFEIIAKRCYELYDSAGKLDCDKQDKVVNELRRRNRDLDLEWSSSVDGVHPGASSEAAGRLICLPLVQGVSTSRSSRASWPYLAIWALLVVAGIAAVYTLEANAFDNIWKATTGNWLIILLVFVLLCTVVMPLIWLYNLPVALRWTRARLRFAVIWSLGLVPLVPVATVLSLVLPSYTYSIEQGKVSTNIAQLNTSEIISGVFVTFAFLVMAWSVCVFIFFLLVGDGSRFYATYLSPHLGVWITFALVLLIIVGGGYLVYPAALVAGQMTSFMWTGLLYLGVVMFPWVLLLMFFCRKRRNLAAHIITDLRLLDPPTASDGHKKESGLLKRILNKTDKQSLLGDNADRLNESQSEGAIVRMLEDEAFNSIEYIFALIVLTVLTAQGWYYLFFPYSDILQGWAQAILQSNNPDSPINIQAMTDYLVVNVSPITLGFVGAYLYIIQMLIRRYLSDDLYPSAYLQSAVRVLVVFMLSLTLGVIAQGFSGANASVGAISVIAFFIGIFPEWGLRLILDMLIRVFTFMHLVRPEGLEVKQPLSKLDGMNIWTEARLLEEGVENVQSMATTSIGQLVTHTHFTTAQIVDWIDQAILYLHCGPNGEWFDHFKCAGIRNATDLLDAVGFDLGKSKNILAPRDFEPKDVEINNVVAAILAGRVIKPRTKVRPAIPAPAAQPASSTGATTGTTQPPNATDATNASGATDATDTATEVTQSANTPEANQEFDPQSSMSPALIRVICDTLWPDQNMQYILNYYTQMKVVAESKDGVEEIQAPSDGLVNPQHALSTLNRL